ncbi:MAG: hypothetical protein R3F37_00855 [Candidatus Competibacteraceae bacterium]
MIASFHGLLYRFVGLCFIIGAHATQAAIPLEQNPGTVPGNTVGSGLAIPLAAVAEELRRRFEVDITTQPVLSKQLGARVATSRFYTQRRYQPAWLTDSG